MNGGMSIWLAVPLALGAALLVGADQRRFDRLDVGAPSVVRRHVADAIHRAARSLS